MRKRQSYWPVLTHHRPCFNFGESIQANADNLINIHEHSSSIILSAFYMLLKVEFVVVLSSYQYYFVYFSPFYRNTKLQTIS